MNGDSETRTYTDDQDSCFLSEQEMGPTEQLLQAALAEQRRDWTTGRRTPAVAWLRIYPALAADPAQAAEIVYHEFLLRQEQGEGLDWDDYRGQFPQYSTLLELLCQADQIVEQAFTPIASAKVPDRFGDYQLLEQIGRGGMGVVYKAQQKSLDRIVAVKMIRAEAHADEAERKRFDREARAVARLCHPNIVQIHEVGEADNQPFIALEFVEGGSLKDRLDGAPMLARRAAALIEVLARAMHHAHEKGVIHRDLKPSNVLLAESSDGLVPKVTDFGLAKRLDAGGDTRSGAILGTPSYMAPEQAEPNKRSVDARTDVYGLGAVLYELLTGRPPFRAESLIQTLQQVLQSEPVPPSLLNPAVPRDLETACLKCLQKEPERRYSSAAELADDLQRWLRGEPVKARRVGALGRAWRWCRRKPMVATLLAALSVTLLVGILGILYQWRETELARREAQASDDQAQQLLNEFLQPGNDTPLKMSRPNTLPDLEEALLKAERHFAGLLQKRPGDIRIRVALTNVRGSLGSLCAVQGRIDEMKAHLQNARDLWEGLALQNPHDPDYRDWLITTYFWEANGANTEGSYERWILMQLRAYSLSEELAEEQPDNPAILRKLAHKRYYLLIHGPWGSPRDEIVRPLEAERAQLLDKAAVENPVNVVFYKRLAFVELILAVIHEGNHSTSEATAYWQQAYEHFSIVSRQKPDDPLVKLNLAWCCSRLMAAEPSDPYYQEAVALLEQAATRLIALTPRDPQDNRSQVTLLETYCSLALCHGKASRVKLAEDIFQKRVWPLVAQLRSYQANEGQSCAWLQLLLRTADSLCQNQPRTALVIVRKVASLLDQYADSPSRNLAFCEYLAICSTNTSAFLCRLGEPEEALRQAEQAQRLSAGLRRAAPDVPAYGYFLSSAWERIAKARWALGRRDEALAAFQEAAAVQRRVVEQAPAIHRYRLSLSRCYDRLANWGSQYGNHALAAAALLERAKLWPNDKERLLESARDFEKLSEAVGNGRKSLSPEEAAERGCYLAEGKRLSEAAHQTAIPGPLH